MRGWLGSGRALTPQPLRVPLPTAPPNGRRRQAWERTARLTAVVLIRGMLCGLSSCSLALGVVTHGGEQQLRAAVLPTTPGPRVLIFALDGAGYNDLMRAIRSGKAPHLQRFL